MAMIIKIHVPAEGFSVTRDYDIHSERIELQGLIEAYMTHLYAGESMTLTCIRRDDIMIIKLESDEWYKAGPHTEMEYQELVKYYKKDRIEEVEKVECKTVVVHALEWGGERE